MAEKVNCKGNPTPTFLTTRMVKLRNGLPRIVKYCSDKRNVLGEVDLHRGLK